MPLSLSKILENLSKTLFDIDPSFSKQQRKQWMISYFKILLLLMIAMPFYIWPLVFAVIIRIVEAEETGGINLATYLALLPTFYAYGSLLKDFLKLQKQKADKNLKIPSLRQSIKNDGLDFLKLIAFQIAAILLNNFSPYTMLEAVSLQIFYFFAHIIIYFYAWIIGKMPVNQRMKNLWS